MTQPRELAVELRGLLSTGGGLAWALDQWHHSLRLSSAAGRLQVEGHGGELGHGTGALLRPCILEDPTEASECMVSSRMHGDGLAARSPRIRSSHRLRSGYASIWQSPGRDTTQVTE